MSKVAARGCAVCRRIGYDVDGMQAIVHHAIHHRFGWGKASNYRTIPLCHAHHADPHIGVHGLNAEAFEAMYGFTEQELIEETQRALSDHVPETERVYQ
jgi:hypothetical protein